MELCVSIKKVYEPLNMIMNGRYAVLYGKLSPAIQQEILSRMAVLIKDEKDYEDKGNYGHFCNILPPLPSTTCSSATGRRPRRPSNSSPPICGLP